MPLLNLLPAFFDTPAFYLRAKHNGFGGDSPSTSFFAILLQFNDDHDDDDDKYVQYDVCEDERGCNNL